MELNLIRLSDPANGVVTKIVQKIMPRGVGVEGWCVGGQDLISELKSNN